MNYDRHYHPGLCPFHSVTDELNDFKDRKTKGDFVVEKLKDKGLILMGPDGTWYYDNLSLILDEVECKDIRDELLWNPAGITNSPYIHCAFSYSSYMHTIVS